MGDKNERGIFIYHQMFLPQNAVFHQILPSILHPANLKPSIPRFPANLKPPIPRFPANSKPSIPRFPANLKPPIPRFPANFEVLFTLKPQYGSAHSINPNILFDRKLNAV